MCISAGIVLYNPNIRRLEENVSAIINQVDKLIIVDNYSENYTDLFKVINKIDYERKILWVKNEKNLGIATALNQICSKAISVGAEWVLTLDQDSVCPNDIIEKYLKYINLNNIGIICPAVYEESIDLKLTRINIDNQIEYVERCISSAAFTNLKIWDTVGKFKDELFIDYVDFDYCARLRKSGYYIIQNNEVLLNHQLGESKNINLWGIRSVRVTNHSAFRKYYISRNIVIYMRNYKSLKVIFTETLRLMKVLAILLVFEENKWKKLKRFTKGINDGLKFV